MSCKSNCICWLDIDRDMRRCMASQEKQHQCKNSLFLYRLTMTKIAQSGVAAQKGGKQLSLEAQIDAVVILAWMADGMHLPPGAIAKVANASIVLEMAIQEIWSRMKAGETPSLIVITKKPGTKMQKPLLMRPWFYRSKVSTLIFGNQFVILPQTLESQLGPSKAL